MRITAILLLVAAPAAAQSLTFMPSQPAPIAPMDLSVSSVPSLQQGYTRDQGTRERDALRGDVDASRSRLDALERDQRDDDFRRALRLR